MYVEKEENGNNIEIKEEEKDLGLNDTFENIEV